MNAANRLTAGTHSGGFTENGITYDANGNIATLNRVGTNPGTFTYSYTGNKLTSLKVNTTPYAYTYDANGNATKDGYRGMDLQYNLLNLPRKVSKGTGSVEYVYLASGAKLAKKVNGVFTQFYNGSVVYKGDKTAEYINTSEGLAMKTASGFAYQYNLSDHLGNVRVVLNQDKSVAQSTNYYPFGLAHATSALEKNKYLYNGKEIQNDVIGGTAFGMLDYGARFYDPAIGRWHSIDPLASKYAGLSGYNYVGNNPMKFIDPDGKDEWNVNQKGQVSWVKKSDTHQLFVTDYKGNRTDKSMDFQDRSVLDQLSKSKKTIPVYDAAGFEYDTEVQRSAYLAKDKREEALSAFKFFADNTKVEWGLTKTKEGYTLKTSEMSVYVRGEDFGTVLVSSMHSHPNTGDRKNELGSMYGDRSNSQKYSSDLFYVYMANSGRAYSVYDGKSNFVKTIKLPSDFYFFK